MEDHGERHCEHWHHDQWKRADKLVRRVSFCSSVTKKTCSLGMRAEATQDARLGRMKIATFNINDVNKRLGNLIGWLRAEKPDVVALQERRDRRPRIPQGRD